MNEDAALRARLATAENAWRFWQDKAKELEVVLARLVHENQQAWDAGCTATASLSEAWAAARAALSPTPER